MPRVTVGLKLLCVLGALVLTTAGARPSYGAPLRVAVAANFRSTAEALVEQYRASTGIDVVISSGSTGVLATQWRNGAPFDLLLAADQTRPDALVADGLTLRKAQCYAQGSLTLLGAADLNVKQALASTSLSIAIANPRSAPYGAAAEAVLREKGALSTDGRRVIMGTNVQQAYQFWQSGAADLALVARSLDPGSGAQIPVHWHDPIRQFAVINADSRQGPAAAAFLDYVLSDKARAVLTANGYERCS